MRATVLVTLFGVFFSINCFAERVLLVDFLGQPVMNLSKGDVQACGVRFIAADIPENPSSNSEIVWISDASFMLDRSGYGMVKAVISKSTVGDIASGGKVVDQEFKTFWMKANGKSATHPIAGEAIDGENKPSKLYLTSATSIMNLYGEVVNKKPIMLGLQFYDSNDFAFSGVVSISDEELNQVTSCMDELLNLMEKDIRP